jgi:hypothetical protein
MATPEHPTTPISSVMDGYGVDCAREKAIEGLLKLGDVRSFQWKITQGRTVSEDIS